MLSPFLYMIVAFSLKSPVNSSVLTFHIQYFFIVAVSALSVLPIPSNIFHMHTYTSYTYSKISLVYFQLTTQFILSHKPL